MRLLSLSLKASRCKNRIIIFAFRRQYSSKSHVENVSVPCWSNGSITVDLHHPATHSAGRNDSANVLIYLPHGPSGQELERDAFNISTLRSQLSCQIVQINYRLSNQNQYPTPIHDMLSGFDWVVDNLLPKRAISRVGRSDAVGQLAVCGEHIGGSLANALALTECRIGQPGVVAAAVSNPVVDWISIDQALKPKTLVAGLKKAITGNSSTSEEALQDLRELRRTLFKKPEHYFDPFASPILFFRSAGAEVPRAPPELPTDDLEQLSLLERDHQELGMTNVTAIATSTQVDLRHPALRKASRRFPSKALGLRLPQFYIATGTASPLRSQADELAHVLRQSFVRQSKNAAPGHSDFGRKVLEDDEMDEDERAVAEKQIAEAAEKVQFHVGDGTGGWNEEFSNTGGLVEAAKWLREKLE